MSDFVPGHAATRSRGADFRTNAPSLKSVSRFALQNVAMQVLGSVAPPYLDFPGERINSAEFQVEGMTDGELAAVVANANGIPMVMPTWLGYMWDKENAFLFPLEPLVSVQGHNIIVRRHVNKGGNDRHLRGSVKERWAQDDYTIRIEGVFLDQDNSYPGNGVARLRELCEAREALYVKNDLLELFGIDAMVVEDYEIPFTEGMAQAYSISGYSDDTFTLLVEDRG